MDFAAYLEFLAIFPSPSVISLRSRRGPRGIEPFELDRYWRSNENFVPVRSRYVDDVVGRSQSSTERLRESHSGFWLLTSGFSYPAVFWRDIKGRSPLASYLPFVIEDRQFRLVK